MMLLKALGIAICIGLLIAAWIALSVTMGVIVQYGLAGGSNDAGALTCLVTLIGSLLTAVIYMILKTTE